jgi:hypothetical protein
MVLGRSIGATRSNRNAAPRRAGKAGAVAYLQSRAWIGLWVRRMAHWWTDHDLLLTPTVGTPPGWAGSPRADRNRARRISATFRTLQFNMTGQPAVSLPLHWTPDACRSACNWLPAAWKTCLVRVASQLEQAAPWADRRPQVHAWRDDLRQAPEDARSITAARAPLVQSAVAVELRTPTCHRRRTASQDDVDARIRGLLTHLTTHRESTLHDHQKPSVLFVCMHNAAAPRWPPVSCASWPAHVDVRSAGSEPADQINP